MEEQAQQQQQQQQQRQEAPPPSSREQAAPGEQPEHPQPAPPPAGGQQEQEQQQQQLSQQQAEQQQQQQQLSLQEADWPLDAGQAAAAAAAGAAGGGAVFYRLDARGKIEAYDEDAWFVPAAPGFKRRQGVAAAMAGNKPAPWKRVRALIAAEGYEALPADTPTYASLAAPPSLYPAKRYCDLTGCAARYTDPATGLRFADAEAFRIARRLTPEEVAARKALRGAASVLK